jgi:23S rRNA (adenine2503-C2)-methyltransferase
MIRTLYPVAVAPDGTTRYAAVADDGAAFELVYQPWPGDATVCMSSQAGCGFACAHCATTYAPISFQRSLTADEIVDAVTRVMCHHRTVGVRTVDFSGIGDSSRNWAAVSQASRRLLASEACRQVAVTSIAPQSWVAKLLSGGDSWLPTRFMFSLHGATRSARRMVITYAEDPAAAMPGWQAVAARCPVTLNYTMHDRNTGPDDVRSLIALLSGRSAFAELQLSPLNAVTGSPVTPVPDPQHFIDQVRDGLPGWNVTVFQPLGTDVEAGCGQLRVRTLREAAA